MQPKNFLSIGDLSDMELRHVIDRATWFGQGEYHRYHPLAGKSVGIYFRKPSTRTRTSFTLAAIELGAATIAYQADDLQTVTGETTEDTGRVLAQYLDALVVRTSGDLDEMRTLARQENMAVINAMSEHEHPTQAIADLALLHDHFGSLNNIAVLYVGDANNTAAALALAVSRIRGMRLYVRTPPGYSLSDQLMRECEKSSSCCGGYVDQSCDLNGFCEPVDAVYTTRWQTTGLPKLESNWRAAFLPYTVTTKLIQKVVRSENSVFMHDLPAVRGEEVEAEVLEGCRSKVLLQAKYKLYGAMAVLEWALVS